MIRRSRTFVAGRTDDGNSAFYGRVCCDRDVRPLQAETLSLEHGRDAADVIAPRAERTGAGALEIDRHAVGVRRRTHDQQPVTSRDQGDRRVAIDGDRHDEAVVVVRVLADEIDPPGRAIFQTSPHKFPTISRSTQTTNLAPLDTAKRKTEVRLRSAPIGPYRSQTPAGVANPDTL